MTRSLYHLRQLTFVSEASNKHEEYKRLLGISDLAWSNLRQQETQDVSISALALQKMRAAAAQMGNVPFFVEHSGLVIDAWKNLPGGLTRVFLENLGNAGICTMMGAYPEDERTATAITVIEFRWPDGREREFKGMKRGVIAEEPVGSHNFGWDPIFIPDDQPGGEQKTYAEMTLEEKNRISMRKAAADQLWEAIKGSFTT